MTSSIAARSAAQIQSTTSPPQPTPAAIPGARVAESIEATRQRLLEIGVLLAADSQADAVQTQLPHAQRALAKLSRRSAGVLGSEAPLVLLADTEDEWTSWKDQLDGWQRTLGGLVAQVDKTIDDVSGFEQQWAQTRLASPAGRLPPELMDGIDKTVVAIRDTSARAQGRREALLMLQGKVAESQTWIDSEISAIEAQRADRRRQLLQLQTAPLWTALAERQGISMRAEATEAWRASARSIVQFVRGSAFAFIFDGALWLAVVAALLRLRARVPRRSDEIRAESIHTLSRPLSAAFLISLVVIQFFAATSSIQVRRLLGLIAAFPTLRLLPGPLFGRSRILMLSLTAACVLSQIGDVTTGWSVLERLVLVGEGLLGIVVLLAIISMRRQARPAAIAAVLGVPVLLVAIGANVWGHVAMARVLTHGTIFSAYVAVIFAVVALVVDDVLTAIHRAGMVDSIRIVQTSGARVRRQLGWVMRLGLVCWWISITLDLFEVRGAVVAAIAAFLAARWDIGSVTLTAGGLLRFAATLWIAILLARLVGFIAAEEVLPRLRLRPGVSDAIAIGLRYAIIAAGLGLAVAAAGVDTGQIALLAGALSVGLGFGLQNVVNNFVSGIILLFERPVKVGDVVEIGPTIGNVRRIGIRSSTIHTSDGADVIVPNGDLISQRLVNWTYTDQRRRIDLPVHVVATADPACVTDLLVRVAGANAGVLSVPAPVALLTSFGDGGLEFSLRFWTERFEVSSRVRSEVAIAARAALRGAGLLGPTPEPAPEGEQ